MMTRWLFLLVLAVAPATHAGAPSFDTLFGLERGATAADLERALGTPDQIEPGDDPILRFAVHPFDPGEPLPPTLDVTLCGDTGRICSFALELPARDTFARRAEALAVLGLPRADLIALLGPPASVSPASLTWRFAAPDRPGETTVVVTLGPGDSAQRLVVDWKTWTTPTRPAPPHPRVSSFARFAGLARGDREERVVAVLGPPSTVTIEARENRRRLEYPGLAIGIDRQTGLVMHLSFDLEAEPFLAARGIDEPGLWVLGKSPAHLRRHLGRPTASSDSETWRWPSPKASKGSLTMLCGLGAVPTCDSAIVDWFVHVPPPPLPKLAVADFARIGPLVHGDTEVELRKKLGEPSRITVQDGTRRFFQYGDGVLTVSFDPAGRIDILMVSPGAVPWLADRGQADPRLGILGRRRAELIRALGRPAPDSDNENISWGTSPIALHRVGLSVTCYDFDNHLCQALTVTW